MRVRGHLRGLHDRSQRDTASHGVQCGGRSARVCRKENNQGDSHEDRERSVGIERLG